MQKWEYLAIRPEPMRVLRDEYIAGQPISKEIGFEKVLNTLGDAGWELVTGAASVMDPYVFKRPKE